MRSYPHAMQQKGGSLGTTYFCHPICWEHQQRHLHNVLGSNNFLYAILCCGTSIRCCRIPRVLDLRPQKRRILCKCLGSKYHVDAIPGHPIGTVGFRIPYRSSSFFPPNHPEILDLSQLEAPKCRKSSHVLHAPSSQLRGGKNAIDAMCWDQSDNGI